MFNGQRNIDRLFREGLRNFEENLPFEVWQSIKGELNKKRKIRRLSAMTRLAASFALVLIFGVGFLILRQNFNNQQLSENNLIISEAGTEFISQENDATSNTGSNSEYENELINKIVQSEANLTPDNQSNQQNTPLIIFASNETQEERTDKEEISGKALIQYSEPLNRVNKSGYTFRYEENNSGSSFLAITDYSKNKYFSEILIDPEKNKLPRWNIGAMFSPIYSYRALKNSFGNAYSDEYVNDIENALLAYSGGVNVNYKTGKRLSFQSGIHYSKVGQSIEDILIYGSWSRTKSESYDNLKSLNNSTGSIEPDRADDYYVDKDDGLIKPANASTGESEQINVNLIQNFNYLEVPLILKYKLIDKKVDVNVFSGLNANILVGNSVYFEHQNERIDVGKTTETKKLNYSGIIGLGFEYEISSRIRLNLEPTLKYYLNSINISKPLDTHPYYFGFFTGISYLF